METFLKDLAVGPVFNNYQTTYILVNTRVTTLNSAK